MLKYIVAAGLFFSSWIGFGAEFIAGKDYEVLSKNRSHYRQGSVVVVMEFFSFGCPSCYQIEPALDRWHKQQADHIHIHKVPVVFNKDWTLYAKAYYAAKAVSLSDKLNPLLFKAILVDKKPLNNRTAMIDFLSKNGMELSVVESVFNHSTSIDMQMEISQRFMSRYGINTVPSFVLNHKFKTDLKMAKTEKRLFEILDYLLKKSLVK
jgi:thiol:disulfide interchange protein DsbA